MIPVNKKTMNVDFNNFIKGIIFEQDIIFFVISDKVN